VSQSIGKQIGERLARHLAKPNRSNVAVSH